MALKQRLDVLRSELEKRGTDGLITEAAADIFYFTGCRDASGWLVIPTSGKPWLLTNAHDGPQARREIETAAVAVWRPGDDPVGQLVAWLTEHGGQRWLIPRQLGAIDRLRQELAPAELLLAAGLTSGLRRVKEPEELATIRQAARIVEAGMAAARAALRPGVREIDVAAAAELAMRRLGQDGRVFETKVESGWCSAEPSRYASEKVIEAGDLVLIDIGPAYHGYFGDLTRTFSIGEPSAEKRQILELVLAAQAASIEAVRAGRSGHDVDAAARDLFAAHGLGDRFLHHTGHTLGLVGDSDSLLAPNRPEPLLTGECVTIEPGIYIDGTGGARIEDEILVTDEGGEVITEFGKDLDDLIIRI